MPTCSAYGCTKRHNKDGPKIRLFRFPTDPSRRKDWQQRVNSDNPDKNWIPGASAVLCQDHFEADQYEANRVDGWRKLKPNAVPTIFNGQQVLTKPQRKVLPNLAKHPHSSVTFEVTRDHSYAKYCCVRVGTSNVGDTEVREDIQDTRNSTMNETEQNHTNNLSDESKIGIWDDSEVEKHHNIFTNDSKINVWNSSDDMHINSPQHTDSYSGRMIKEEPPDSLPQNSPIHPPPTAEEDMDVVKEEVPDPSCSSLSEIGDGEETQGNVIANNTPSDINFDLPLPVKPAIDMAGNQKLWDEWLQMEEFKPWLERLDEDPTKAYCNKCRFTFSGKLATIKCHMKTQIHAASSSQEFRQEDQQGCQDIRYKINLAYILLICFMAEHNLPFFIADHMTDLFKTIFPDSAIAQGLHMKRTKCTEIANKVGLVISEEIVRDLRQYKFSIIIDESTDISATKCLTVIAKFYNSAKGIIVTKMLDLINIYGEKMHTTGSSGQSLYNMIIETLNFHDIPLNNLVGFAADGASNLMGESHSLCSRLRENFPGITILKCICHSLHLCASEAAKTLPGHCEDLIRSIYTYFAHSAKRKYEFKQFQTLLSIKPHKILHPSQTRWLSLHQAVERILEQWDALKEYFSVMEKKEKLRSVTLILRDVSDPSVFLYLNFLKFILPTLTSLNLLFQKETPTIFHVNVHLNRLYKTTLQYFCRKELLDKSEIDTFDPANSTNHVPLNNIYLGSYVHELLQKDEFNRNIKMVDDVKKRCKFFMIKLCEEIKIKFELNDSLWQMTSYFFPDKFMDSRSRDMMPSLYPLVECLPRIYTGDVQVLDNEWRHLDSVPLPTEITTNSCDPVLFYTKFGNMTENNEYLFKTLATFSLNILALPVTNTDAERLFSKLHLIKTDIGNKLNIHSLKSLCYVSEAVREQGECYKFKVSGAMMESL